MRWVTWCCVVIRVIHSVGCVPESEWRSLRWPVRVRGRFSGPPAKASMRGFDKNIHVFDDPKSVPGPRLAGGFGIGQFACRRGKQNESALGSCLTKRRQSASLPETFSGASKTWMFSLQPRMDAFAGGPEKVSGRGALPPQRAHISTERSSHLLCAEA